MSSLQVPAHLCYHCFLDIPKGTDFSVEIDGHSRAMCCPGCQAVAQTIVASGLQNYYRHRTGEAIPASDRGVSELEQIKAEFALYNSPDIQREFVATVEHESEATLVIEGITCAACVWLLEHHISNQPGVSEASVNMSNHRARIRWDDSQVQLSQLLTEIYQIGYTAHPYRADVEEQLLIKERKRALRRLGVAAIGMMQIGTLAIALYAGAFSSIDASSQFYMRWSSLILATPVVLYAALPFFQAALRDIRTRHLSMDVPVSIAIGGAYLASIWATVTQSGEIYFDSVTMFTFFLLLGRYLEMQARHRSGRAGNALLNLLPASALKVTQHQGVENETLVTVSELAANDIVLVKPGQTIPCDGIIARGGSSIDESALTGEYLPKRRLEGEPVIGGTLNVENPLYISVSHIGEQTQLSAIVRLLERAQQDKPKLAKLADTVSNYFVAFVLIASAIVSISWWIISPEHAFWVTLSVLVVTCPCALSLATPTALTAATGTLRQLGLLITRGHVLESLSSASDIVFDKTGTLTQGNLAIDNVVCLDSQCDQSQALRIAAALESHSEHPIAKAFQTHFAESAREVNTALGEGIEGEYQGMRYRLGKASYAAQLCASAELEAPRASGHWLLLCSQHAPLAWIEISDSLRSDAAETIGALKALGLKVHMLTGDSSSAVDDVAQALGIDAIQRNASPQQKLDYIHQLQKNGAKVVMVGDGINDLPVLAGAHTSIAMGSASDLAKTHADAVLSAAQLNTLAKAVRLSRKTKRVIKQNIIWAFGYNLTAFPLAAFGLIPPYLAAVGMSASSLIVVGNAMRLSRYRR
ncbi:MAG: heavy metal translocating P-type ATPase [Pseudomonadales bacterium]